MTNERPATPNRLRTTTTPKNPGANRTQPDHTPHRNKTHSITSYSSSKTPKTDDVEYTGFWANRLRENSRTCNDTDEFLSDFVPGFDPTIACPTGLFTEYRPRKPIEDCIGMARALNKLMTYIPQERRIAFASTRSVTFPPLFPSEHKTRPDVSGTYPGQSLPDKKAWTWNLCPIDIEIKSIASQDPVANSNQFKSGKRHDSTLAQIAKNGRNILASNGACFCFVIGVYGDAARIYRFDRACAVISPSFDIRKSDVLFRFLWRIVHPRISLPLDGSISSVPSLLGLDATINTLTEEEKIWLRQSLIDKHNYDEKMATERATQSKKVLAMYAPLEPGPEPVLTWSYTIGKPLSQSSGLFARATKVWKVLFKEDVDHFFAVKDAWRHLYRRYELDFYDHVRKRYKSTYPPGLARAMGGIDFGTHPDFRVQHKTNSFEPYELNEGEGAEEGDEDSEQDESADDEEGSEYTDQDEEAEYYDDEEALYDEVDHTQEIEYDEEAVHDDYHEADLYEDAGTVEGEEQGVAGESTYRSTSDEGNRDLSSRPYTPPISEPVSEPNTGPSSPAILEEADASRSGSSPQQEILPDQNLVDLNRSHTRTTFYPVGTPIETFVSTKQLVSAIRDAIKAHQSLTECGLLHRDISANNILLAPNQEGGGFLHDMDYSTYIPELDKFASEGEADNSVLLSPTSSIPRSLKEMTGTYQFMAREILEGNISHRPTHDLESFMWLILWVVLRRVDHRESLGALHAVLDQSANSPASLVKLAWLLKVHNGKTQIKVTGNTPLSGLLLQLCSLFHQHDNVDHAQVLRLFEGALHCEGWPTNDYARSYHTPKSNRYEPYLGGVRTSASKRPAQAEIDERTTKKKKTLRPHQTTTRRQARRNRVRLRTVRGTQGLPAKQ